jgi:hypothetical protein
MTYGFQRGHARKSMSAFLGGLILAIVVITWISGVAENARPPQAPIAKEVSR